MSGMRFPAFAPRTYVARAMHSCMRCAWLVALLFAAIVAPAGAQPWPSKPLRIIVPYTAGGPADLLARAMAQTMTETWGQQVIVDNRPGANEIIAATAVAKSPPDGYTWLLASDASFVLNPNLYTKLQYDPERELAPVARLVTANMVLVGRPDLPPNTVTELIEYVRKNPRKLTYGSVGVGGVNHLAMAWFATLNGLQMEHVPYKGLVDALRDLTTGRLDIMFAVAGGAAPFLNDGKLKAFAVSGKSRLPVIPNVRTFAEAGYPDFDASFYFALAAPANTPSDIVEKFAAEAGRIVKATAFQEKYLTSLGFEPALETPSQFAAFLRTDRELAAKKVKASGAKLD